jgi:transmembrane 9 superfamily member 2/4
MPTKRCQLWSPMLIIVTLVLIVRTAAISARTYHMGDAVPLYTSPMSSLRTHFPLLYDKTLLPVCPRTDDVNGVQPVSIGDVLLGNRVTLGPYGPYLAFGEDMKRTVMCTLHNVLESRRSCFRQAIADGYTLNLRLMDVPLTLAATDGGAPGTGGSLGVPLGVADAGTTTVFNHLRFTITYAPVDDSASRFYIVAFEGYPQIDDDQPMTDSGDVMWTYSVRWRREPLGYRSLAVQSLRSAKEGEAQAMSIFNSICVVVAVAFVIVKLWRRGKHVTVDRIELALLGNVQLTACWNVVYKDVFRPPQQAWLLAAFVGAGSHALVVTLSMLAAVQCRIINDGQGAVLTFFITGLALLGFVPGYVAALVLKSWGVLGTFRWLCAVLAASIVPCVAFGSEPKCAHALVAFPIPVFVTLLALHVLVVVPLAILGAAVGFRSSVLLYAYTPSPRCIPHTTVWLAKPWVVFLFQAHLTCGPLLVGANLVWNSIWLRTSFDSWGFALCTFVLALISSAVISIFCCVVQLGVEDYNWAWRSFIAGASSGVVMFLYSVQYFFKLPISGTFPVLHYFACMSVVSALLSAMTGCMSFVACWWTVRYLRSTIDVDEV